MIFQFLHLCHSHASTSRKLNYTCNYKLIGYLFWSFFFLKYLYFLVFNLNVAHEW